MAPLPVEDEFILERADFSKLLDRIANLGYHIVGPTIRDGAIVYGEIRSENDLPIGWTDRQEAGQYRLERRSDGALFGYNVGPHSWKQFLFPARERLWTAKRDGVSFTAEADVDSGSPLAFLGMRACELAGLEVTDRVFDGVGHDPGYRRRRRQLLKVAVQCGQAGGTCFCVSMGTGPGVRNGYDLALTEILAANRHHFVVRVGTETGAALLAGLPVRPARVEDRNEAAELVQRTAASMGRQMDTTGIRELLISNLEHPRWEIVARRCLSCTNCTMVCPTCFCHTTEEVPDLSGDQVEHWRRWDSCFNLAFSQLHTANVRKTPLSRYRQWLTHKLATWQDQFGTSGCIGCGRCITWCPVGIDLTEEVAAIRTRTAGEKPQEAAP